MTNYYIAFGEGICFDEFNKFIETYEEENIPKLKRIQQRINMNNTTDNEKIKNRAETVQ